MSSILGTVVNKYSVLQVELSKRAARPVSGRSIRASGSVGSGLKSPGKKRATKLRPEPGPERAFGPARFFFKKTFLKQ
jgi:hypothetical protein